MNVALLTSDVRLAIAAMVAALAIVAFALRHRATRVAARAALIAGLAAAVVIVDRVASFLAESAGEHTALNDHAWAWSPPWGTAGACLGIGLAAVAIVLGAIAGLRIRSPWQRALLLGLRILGVSAALAVLLRPAVELLHIEHEPNQVAVLVDVSRSMGLAGKDEASRLARAKAVVQASVPTFESWQGRHRVHFFTFSSAAIASSASAIAAATPRGAETRILGALQAIATQLGGGEDLAGIILISDGVDTTGFDPKAAEGLATVGPVHTISPVQGGLKDIALARILADGIAFVRTPITIEAVIRSVGFPRDRLRVTLRKDGHVIGQTWAEPKADDNTARVAFELVPERVGKHVIEISTPVKRGEAVTENNHRTLVLNVIRDKLRVLQVAGQPSWDVRALRGLLDQNPNIDLISFFILRTHEDVSLVPESELSLIQFPTRELFEQALPTFDLVILQNFNYLPYGLGIYLDNIRDYVEDGGGLVMLGGELSFASGGYGGTPIAPVLPVTLSAVAGEAIDTEEFAPVLTEAGRAHPITALRYNVAANARAWKELPPLEGVNIVTGARPGAAVLVAHPKLTTRSGEPMPVIAAAEIRDGRSLAITTDSLWRWQFWTAGQGDTGSSYAAFWENAIRWLTRDPDLRHLRVTAHPGAGPNEPVTVEVELSSPDYTPLSAVDVKLDIAPIGDGSARTTTVATDEDGRARAILRELAPGPYRVTARAEVAGRPTRATDVLVVPAADAELRQPAADEAAMAAIAEQTGGIFLGNAAMIPEDLPLLPPRSRTIGRQVTVELWSRPGLLILALVLLGLEWGLRRRAHTL